MTKRLQSDPFLEDVGCVILDEFHERSIHTDLAISLLKEIQQSVRPDLRLIIMSATLSLKRLSSYLSGAPCVDSAGRSYPVTVHWKERVDERRPIDQLVGTIKRAQKLRMEMPSFFTGSSGNSASVSELQTVYGDKISFPPIAHCLGRAGCRHYAAEKEKLFFLQYRRIVLTIPGVKIVVDKGLEQSCFMTLLEASINLRPCESVGQAQSSGRVEPVVLGSCFSMDEVRAPKSQRFCPSRNSPH